MSDKLSPAFAQTLYARTLAASLVEAGVRDVVVSPGSRSTPLVLALAARSELRLVDVIDERSAAFVALGHARVSGAPAALLCTSGTAPAHWYPAVLEASLAELPLVGISADRPFDLHHAGASQTLDQTRLFGDHVRFFADLGGADARLGALRGLRRTVLQAIALSCAPRPGPVHLNARASKPLEPVPAETDAERALERDLDTILAKPSRAARASLLAEPAALDEVAALLAASRRPWIVAGPLPRSACDALGATLELARRSGAALAAEGASQLRLRGARPEGVLGLDAFDLLLRNAERFETLGPDLVLHVGAWPTSSAWDRFAAARPDVPRVRLGAAAAGPWIDPPGSARLHVPGELEPTLRALAERMREPSADPGWREAVRAFEERAWGAIEARIDRETHATALGEGAAMRTILRALPHRAHLVIGNSLPIRTLDRFVASDAADLDVLSQRGAAGIDGLVSGANGAARASGVPTVLVLGDVSALHDLGGLASAHLVRESALVVVVLDNGGGRIFEHLPVARRDDLRSAMPHFTTPRSLDLAHASALFELPFARASDVATLDAAMRAALARAGVTLVQVPVDPRSALEADRELDDALGGRR